MERSVTPDVPKSQLAGVHLIDVRRSADRDASTEALPAASWHDPEKYGLADPVLQQLAVIVRAADTDRLDLAPQAAGLRPASGSSCRASSVHWRP